MSATPRAGDGALPGEGDRLLASSKEAAGLPTAAAHPRGDQSSKTRPRACSCSSEELLGATLILIVALIWTGASMLVQFITKNGFNRPFFLTYVSNALFSVLLAFEFCRARLGTRPGGEWLAHPGDASWRREARAAMFVFVVWFAAQETYNASLGGTTVSVSTILSSTSSVFTLAQSALFLGERVGWGVAAGVVVCVAGAVAAAVASQNPGQGTSTALGVGLALLSAALYGSYTVLIRRTTPADPAGERAFNLRVMFGLIGLFNLVLLAPVVLVLHATGTEDLTPLTPAIFGLIVLKGLADNVLSDLLWAHAILLTSPTVATVGLSLTVPFAMIADLITPGIVPSWTMVLGGTLVVAGFVISNLANDPAEVKAATLAATGSAAPADATHAPAMSGQLDQAPDTEAGPAPSPLSEEEDKHGA